METKEAYIKEFRRLSSELWLLRTRINADSHKDRETRCAGEILGQISLMIDTLENLIDKED